MTNGNPVGQAQGERNIESTFKDVLRLTVPTWAEDFLPRFANWGSPGSTTFSVNFLQLA